MEKLNKKILIAGILYLIYAIFMFKFTVTFGGFLLFTGVIITSYSTLPANDLKDKKVMLLLLIIISLIINIPSAVFLIIATKEITSLKKEANNSPPTEKIDNEAKRIDNLL